MIAEKVIGSLKPTSKQIETVTIDWYERDKKLLRKTTSAGEEIGITVQEPLKEGDILFEDETRVIAVEIAPCDLVAVEVSSMEEMGKLCFELGNRHLSLSIENNRVKCPFDEPTFEYLKRLGFAARKVQEKFSGVLECRAHAHGHHHEH